MTRLFEAATTVAGTTTRSLIDMDKVCSVRLEMEKGHHYPRLVIRFVTGDEVSDLVPPELASRFAEAFRAHLRGAPPPA